MPLPLFNMICWKQIRKSPRMRLRSRPQSYCGYAKGRQFASIYYEFAPKTMEVAQGGSL